MASLFIYRENALLMYDVCNLGVCNGQGQSLCFSKVETRNIIKDMPSEKSPGLGGFTGPRKDPGGDMTNGTTSRSAKITVLQNNIAK